MLIHFGDVLFESPGMDQCSNAQLRGCAKIDTKSDVKAVIFECAPNRRDEANLNIIMSQVFFFSMRGFVGCI